LAGFGSDQNCGWVDGLHVRADFARGVPQPVAANVNSLPLIP
jgi:hypothetical protein